MLKAEWADYSLDFKFDARTSRGSMQRKDTYFVRVYDTDAPAIYGIGECALFKGLSHDDCADYEDILSKSCREPLTPAPYSSIRFGMETALLDLKNGGCKRLFDNDFYHGRLAIPINGLIWMGDKATMAGRIREKLEAGFRVLKLKIGGICFDDEVDLLRYIRSKFPADILELRLDANGSFPVGQAMKRLEQLAKFDIHSIEQPVRPGLRLPGKSPIPVALDEELIGVRTASEKAGLLDEIKPEYIILKPALCGGLRDADEWTACAESRGIGWWATSALESNIGLNAIAQWVAGHGIVRPQGLGTGLLFHNNIVSPLRLVGDTLTYVPGADWGNLDLKWRQ